MLPLVALLAVFVLGGETAGARSRGSSCGSAPSSSSSRGALTRAGPGPATIGPMRLSRHPHVEVDPRRPRPPPTRSGPSRRPSARPSTERSLAFLAQANGGKLDYIFELPTDTGPFPLCFYTLYSTRLPFPGRAPAGLVLHELELERRLKVLRPGLLPIAADGGTSVLYVDLAPERRGRVVAYVEGLPGWDGTPEGSFVDVAPDLDAFLSGALPEYRRRA